MDSYKIRKGKPPIGGIYVCYVDDPITEDWCLEQIRIWHAGSGWQGNPPGTVYGWVGPLPAFKRGETKPLPAEPSTLFERMSALAQGKPEKPETMEFDL